MIDKTRRNYWVEPFKVLEAQKWKQDSRSYRLAYRTSKEIPEIKIAGSKKGLIKNTRTSAF